jgi:hypothetical protein
MTGDTLFSLSSEIKNKIFYSFFFFSLICEILEVTYTPVTFTTI